MKTVTIGPYDGDQVQIQVEDNATLSQALQQAGLRLTSQQSLSSYTTAQDLNLSDVVRDGETYLITGNQTSGSL